MARDRVFSVAALVLLGMAGALLHIRYDVAEVPLVRPFDAFPARLEGWNQSDPGPEEILRPDTHAPERLFRTYRHGAKTIWFSVGYYPKQSEVLRPPVPELVAPARGWRTLTRHRIRIPLDEHPLGSIAANLLVKETGERRTAILYWYQVRAATIASDHWYRAVLLFNRIVHGRADGAVVRVAFPVGRSRDPGGIVAEQGDFLRACYRELLKSLPR